MLIKSYRLTTDRPMNDATRLLLFRTTVPLRYRVLSAFFDRSLTQAYTPMLELRLREFGPACQPARFLVVFAALNDIFSEVELPKILLGPNDPPDSDDLQFSFWQSSRVGGSITHDVFDVSHMKLAGFDDQNLGGSASGAAG
jgi:hypothetical protein